MGTFAWGSHTEGAIQLAIARGRKQLETKTGLSLFTAVRTQMVSHLSLSVSEPACRRNRLCYPPRYQRFELERF